MKQLVWILMILNVESTIQPVRLRDYFNKRIHKNYSLGQEQNQHSVINWLKVFELKLTTNTISDIDIIENDHKLLEMVEEFAIQKFEDLEKFNYLAEFAQDDEDELAPFDYEGTGYENTRLCRYTQA